MALLEEAEKQRMLELPQCPHLHRESSSCMSCTRTLGEVFHVDGVFCNSTCSASGPNLGRSLTKEQKKEWEESLFRSYFHRFGFGSLLRKVRARHERRMTIKLPDNYRSIRRAFESLYLRDEIQMVCATGSIIAKESKGKPKDLDIVVVIDPSMLQQFLDNKEEIQALAPKEIDGVPVDLFWMLHPSAYFISLSLFTFKVYISSSCSNVTLSEGLYGPYRPDNYGKYDTLLQEAFDSFSKKEEGLGDKVEKLIKNIPIVNRTKKVRKGCAGCKKRKEALNRLGRRISK